MYTHVYTQIYTHHREPQRDRHVVRDRESHVVHVKDHELRRETDEKADRYMGHRLQQGFPFGLHHTVSSSSTLTPRSSRIDRASRIYQPLSKSAGMSSGRVMQTRAPSVLGTLFPEPT